MYALYIKEREGAEIYEDERGFFTYVVENDIFQINDLFILPELRGNGVGRDFSNLIDEFARKNDCRICVCTTCTDAKNWQVSEAYILASGYTKIKQDATLIYYKKEL